MSSRPSRSLLLDNGGDLFMEYLAAPYDGLRGGTEETTSGRDRLTTVRAELGLPVLVINDSPIKQFAENTPRRRPERLRVLHAADQPVDAGQARRRSSATGRAAAA